MLSLLFSSPQVLGFDRGNVNSHPTITPWQNSPHPLPERGRRRGKRQDCQVAIPLRDMGGVGANEGRAESRCNRYWERQAVSFLYHKLF